MNNKTIDIFLALVRAGLWEETSANHNNNESLFCKLSEQVRANKKVSWDEVYKLAEEQSVIGVVLAGIEHSNVKPPQELLLQWIGEVQMLEQQNKEMNRFIAELVLKMRTADIYTLLVKGQGVAQCYERPLWRSPGDIDLFMSDSNYDKAKEYLVPIAESVDTERGSHFGMTIDSWVVELHGHLSTGLSGKIDNVILEAQNDCFYNGNVRSWSNGDTHVFLPGIDNDIIFIFTHYLKHFYKGGLGLRQICDWCRLLWTYKDSLNQVLLGKRIKKMGLMSEWNAFASFAVNYLGIPVDAMPFYSTDAKWKRKADRICAFILEVGNMGHNRDTSYFNKYPYFIRKMISMGRRCGDLIRHARIFPLDSLRFFPNIMFDGVRSAIKGY